VIDKLLHIEPKAEKEGKMAIENVLADKYLPVENGIYFIVPVENLEMTTEEILVVRNKDHVFLKNGNIYAGLTEKIIEHLNNVMHTNETIVAIFTHCSPEDYEIRKVVKVEWSKTECATIIGYFSVFREQILKEMKTALKE
jgi:hypothetical protein